MPIYDHLFPRWSIMRRAHRVVVPPVPARRVCLLVTVLDERARVKARVRRLVADVQAAGYAVIVIAVCRSQPLRIEGPLPGDGLILRANSGFDFAAWAASLYLFPWLWACEGLLFLNDSVFHSSERLAATLDAMRSADADIVAVTGNDAIAPHFQSYCFLYKPAAIRAMRSFWERVIPRSTKFRTIRFYEVPQKATALGKGLKVLELQPARHDGRDPTLTWAPVQNGSPFLKVSFMRHNPYEEDFVDWRTRVAPLGFLVDEIESELPAVGHLLPPKSDAT